MSDLSHPLCKDCGEPEPFCVCDDSDDLDPPEWAWPDDDADPEIVWEEQMISDLEDGDPEEEWLRRQAEEQAP
jgi:hypothetical protein